MILLVNLKVINKNLEAVLQRCSLKKVFLETSQNSQENTCAIVSFLIKLQAGELCEISKNTFLNRTPLVAASENLQITKNHNKM